jgi:hypothetical protein
LIFFLLTFRNHVPEGIYASAQEGEDMMKYELTPERVMEIGKGFEDAFLACLPIDKRLKGLKPEERIAGLKPEDILASLSVVVFILQAGENCIFAAMLQ